MRVFLTDLARSVSHPECLRTTVHHSVGSTFSNSGPAKRRAKPLARATEISTRCDHLVLDEGDLW